MDVEKEGNLPPKVNKKIQKKRKMKFNQGRSTKEQKKRARKIAKAPILVSMMEE